MFFPEGAVATGVRKRENVNGDDPDGLVLKLSGVGCIVRITDNKDGRRALDRYADANGITLFRITPDNRPKQHRGRNAGGRMKGQPAGPSMARADYECVGSGSSLRALAGQPFVVLAEDIVNVRVPVTAGGSGEEKPRPSMGSAFGKPAQVAATAAALAKGRSDRMRDAVRAGQM